MGKIIFSVVILIFCGVSEGKVVNGIEDQTNNEIYDEFSNETEINDDDFAKGLREFEEEIIFYGFKGSYDNRFISTFDTPISEQGCDMDGKFSMVVHGWLEGIETKWVADTVNGLLKHRGGCVFFMDYSKYSKNWNYFDLVPKFDSLSAILLKKFQQIGNFDRQFCYGFSFGSRLCVDAGINLGEQTIDRMDLCELTGPGFEPMWFFWPNPKSRDPKLAAKNVQCINTSNDKGTTVYNCHQNFRMGVCGLAQTAAGPFPMGSHGLCPFFYNSAFENVFAPNNFFNCVSMSQANTTGDTRMGYLGNFDGVRGEIFVATARHPPYVVVNGVVENLP